MAMQPNETATQPFHLCPRCATSGIGTLYVLDDIRVVKAACMDLQLGSICSWNLDTCHFCQFFFQCLPSRYRSDPATEETFRLVFTSGTQFAHDAGVIIRALPFHDLERKTFVVEDCHNGIGIHQPASTIVLLRDEEQSRREPTSAMIDFAMLSGWLKEAPPKESAAPLQRKLSGSRKFSMAKPPRTGSWKRARSGVLDLNLGVIDCTSRRIVSLPPHEEYVTLSYVWGHASGQIKRRTSRRPDSMLGSRRLPASGVMDAEDKGTLLSSQLPLTIEDSITVCTALHYRYLWVDRYCIPQKDRQMRTRQMQQMDDIYCGSALTLIACAGAGPQYGLPGVSRSRTACPTIRIGNSHYLQMLPTVHDIRSSTWASRAWTYQEGLLAQRRLFFTDRQVYFESNNLVESELTTLAPVVTRVLDPRICSQVTSSSFPGDIYGCLLEYTRRKLTFQSDIMNALLGILAFYAHEHGILHLWGIPFSVNTPASINEPPRKRIVTFEESLRWYAKGNHSRREGFPSWSWVGWLGALSWRSWRSDLKPAAAPFEQGSISFMVELMSGQLLSWAEFQLRHTELNDSSRLVDQSKTADQLTQFIHIEGLVSNITTAYNANQHTGALNLDKFSLKTIDDTAPLTLNQFSNPAADADKPSHISLSSAESFMAIHFPCWQQSGKGTSGSMLVIRDRGEYWERVALLDDDNRILHRAKKRRMTIRLG
jgi:hypothetical protein